MYLFCCFLWLPSPTLNTSIDVGISPCISYHHYYPRSVVFYDCHPYFKTQFWIVFIPVIIMAGHTLISGCVGWGLLTAMCLALSFSTARALFLAISGCWAASSSRNWFIVNWNKTEITWLCSLCSRRSLLQKLLIREVFLFPTSLIEVYFLSFEHSELNGKYALYCWDMQARRGWAAGACALVVNHAFRDC